MEVLLKPPPVFRASIEVDGAPIRGPKVAPVTIVEYSDFHCPFCRRVQPTLLQLLAKYPTQVRLIYKHLPLDNLHPQARKFAEASWCAAEQNRFWQFHDAVYAEANPTGAAAERSRREVRASTWRSSNRASRPARRRPSCRRRPTRVRGTASTARLASSSTDGRSRARFRIETFVRLIDEELAARP